MNSAKVTMDTKNKLDGFAQVQENSVMNEMNEKSCARSPARLPSGYAGNLNW